MAESPTKKAKKEHTPESITATSIWDGLRVAAEGKEQSLIGALDEDGELGWLEDDRDDDVAHFARKPWLAAMLHDSERNQAYARAISKAAEAAPEGCVALEVGAGTGLLTQLLCKEDRIGHVVACEMEPALAKIPYFVVLKFVALVFAYYDRSFPDLLVRFYGALVSKIGTATKSAGGAAGKSD